jgi:hypothetical protein
MCAVLILGDGAMECLSPSPSCTKAMKTAYPWRLAFLLIIIIGMLICETA